MDRKSKILSMALSKKDKQCLDFLEIRNYERKGTDSNERDLCIQEQHKIIQNKNIFKNCDQETPESHLKTQVDRVQVENVSSTEKVVGTRLQTMKRKLFEEKKSEDISLDQHLHLERLRSSEISSTIKEMDNSDENDEANSSGSEYIPDPLSSSSDSEIELEDSFVEELKEFDNKKAETISDVSTEPTEPSNSAGKVVVTVVEKSPKDFGSYKQDGKIRSGNKKMDFCFFCETLALNFARHIARNHSSETEVQKILSNAPGSNERRRLLDLLRKKGNFLNSNVARKPVQSLRSAEDLLPCDNCLGFFSAKLLWRHRIKCTNLKDKNSKATAQNMLLTNLKIDHNLKNTVFPRMRADEISLVAKMDPIICAFGARYMKVHREKHFINVTSRKMREISRLLIALKTIEPTIKCLFDALKPKHFDAIIIATKTVAKYNVEKDKYESPTYAMNMGTYLKQCAEIAIVFALKRKNVAETVISAEAEADLKTLIKVIESQWQYEISSQAANDININKWNKVTLVPLASDLKLLKDYLVSKANLAVTALNNNDSISDYKVLLETIFCRVILLNRRRPGELQRLKIDIYEISENNNSSSNYEEFSEVVSPAERILLKRFKRIVIRGKRGRGVPVLFSPDTQDHIKVLLHYRNKFVNEGNLFLFGNPGSNEPICGYKVLQKYATACGAKNPSAITATRLRKHLATLTQLFDMSENDLEQLANFMGHTIGVHRDNYRLPNDVYQTAKISKLLLLMEKGQAAQFKGKTLNDINLDLEEDLMIDDEEDKREKVPSPLPGILEPATSKMQEQKEKPIPKKRKRVHVKWTSEQRNTVIRFFASNITNKKPPKRNECEELKSRYPELLQNKNWTKIKVYIQNEYQKN